MEEHEFNENETCQTTTGTRTNQRMQGTYETQENRRRTIEFYIMPAVSEAQAFSIHLHQDT